MWRSPDGVEDRDTERKRSNAAPGFGEVAGREPFHVQRAGAVVAGNDVDEVAFSCDAKIYLVRAETDWRCALVQGAAIVDLFGGEVDVVRTGLDCDGQAFAFGAPDQRQAEMGCEMDDVDARAELAAKG